MVLGRDGSFAKWILALWLCGILGVGHATPLIMLPTGEITRLNYAGQELFIDTNKNGRPDAGDVFEGVVSISQISGATSGADFSSQLADKEITSHFHFSVTGNSSDFSHLEFGLLSGAPSICMWGKAPAKILILLPRMPTPEPRMGNCG